MRARLGIPFALLVACDGRLAASTEPLNPRSEVTLEFNLGAPSPRDLFVVVDSVATDDERAHEAEIVATVVRGLVTGDVDADGRREIMPVNDLRVMIVPADPAILRPEAIPNFAFEFARGDDPAAFVRLVREGARQPLAGGSPWSQPLEAALFAITRGCVPREAASVGIVFLTTSDDCSLADPELADPASTRYSGTREERCVRYAETALHPFSRYAPLLGRDERDRFAIALLGGPATVSPYAWRGTAVVRHPLLDGEFACTTAAGTAVRHADRLAAFVGWNGVVDSICAGEHVEALRPFWTMLSPAASGGGCLGWYEPLDFASCRLVEVMPIDGADACASLEGREAITRWDGASECVVRRVVGFDDRAAGWAGGHGDAPAWECEGRPFIGFTRVFRHRERARYRLECVVDPFVDGRR